MTTPLVSVVIPAYNRMESIRDAVASVLRQDFNDFEVLVVDDASNDATAEVVKGIKDPRLRLLQHNTNRGAGAARNTGIAEARGAWVAFQDSDDEWLPGKLRKQMARLIAPEAKFVAGYCGMIIIGLHDHKPGERREMRYIPYVGHKHVSGDILETLLKASIVSTQTLVARKKSLLDIDGFDESLPSLEDWECMIRLSNIGDFDFLDEPLVFQYFSKNSITKNEEKLANAREAIISKHHSLFDLHPGVLGHHYRSLAGQLRRMGKIAEARRVLAEARRALPRDLRLRALSVALFALEGVRR